ncbi:hypothetical protein PVK06_038804 [Gossypium arboreum]|uniref:RNase H type-1 domain-containing protein n=1 Tax=Gossypium arboreum TaxID=29729 RepID=A0ABR0N1C5_GOSAR|nr:hypothetical protein PVK06_038804 [Gossypium arboreum]
MPLSVAAGSDICIWRDTSHGLCTVGSAYCKLAGANWEPKDGKWKNKGLNPREVVLRSLCMAKGYFSSTNNTVGSKRLTDSVTEWSKNPCGAVKINTDRARADSGMMASAGGVIRDDKGQWILGFSQNIGVGTVLQSELLAIFDGFSIAWSWGYREVILERDCKETVDLINAGVYFLPSLALVKDIQNMSSLHLFEEPTPAILKLLELDAPGFISDIVSLS